MCDFNSGVSNLQIIV